MPNNNPRLSFGRGVYMRQILGDAFERVTQSGAHLKFVEHAEIVYQSTLEAERMKSRAYPQ